MTAKEEKQNFITHYLEDWIPERLQPETLQRLDEVIESYCREQRELVANELKTWTEDISIPNQYKINDLCMNTDMPEL